MKYIGKIKHLAEANEGDIENLWYMVEYLVEKVESLENEIKNVKI